MTDRSTRRAATERYVERQKRIAESHGRNSISNNRRYQEPHRMAKHSYANCGRKNCWFCMNPRRRGELTIQEKRMNEDRDSFVDKTGLLTKDST